MFIAIRAAPLRLRSMFARSVLSVALVAVAVVAVSAMPHDRDSESVAKPTLVPVTDPAWFWSPYNWRPLLAGVHSEQPGEGEGGVVAVQSANPGAYFKLAFSGSSFTLRLNTTGGPKTDHMLLRWSVDDARWTEARIPSVLKKKDELVLAKNLNASAPHTLWFIIVASVQTVDRWLGPANVVRITGAALDAGAQLSAYPMLQPKRALVFWDSIGEGVLAGKCGSKGLLSDLANNDATRNWVQPLAQALGAEVGAVAFGAQGWIRTGAGNVAPVNNVYTGNASTHAWSHFDSHASRLDSEGLLQPPPDIVVMGHATNDHTFPAENVTACALDWLPQIRKAAGQQAHVVFTVPYGQFQAEALLAAYQAYTAEAPDDHHTHFVDLAPFNAQQGLSHSHANLYSCDGVHPIGWRSEQLGAMLAAQIQAKITGTERPEDSTEEL